jgi:hypothetical protein
VSITLSHLSRIRCVDSPRHPERHVQSISELGNVRKGRSYPFRFLFVSVLLSDLGGDGSSSFFCCGGFFLLQAVIRLIVWLSYRRARLRRPRAWARWVSCSLSVLDMLRMISIKRTPSSPPCAGMGLLYYGQNFLIYPSAFPAGARESAYPPSLPRSFPALPPCSD